MRMFNVGILGCGQIAAVMAQNLAGVDGIRVAAVASREKKRATAFAKKYCPDAKAFGTYEIPVKLHPQVTATLKVSVKEQ